MSEETGVFDFPQRRKLDRSALNRPEDALVADSVRLVDGIRTRGLKLRALVRSTLKTGGLGGIRAGQASGAGLGGLGGLAESMVRLETLRRLVLNFDVGRYFDAANTTWIRSWGLMTRPSPVVDNEAAFASYISFCKLLRVEYPPYLLRALSYVERKFAGKSETFEGVNTLGTGELATDAIVHDIVRLRGWSDKCLLVKMTYLRSKLFGLIVLFKDHTTSGLVDLTQFESLGDGSNTLYRLVAKGDPNKPDFRPSPDLQLMSVPEQPFARWCVCFDHDAKETVLLDMFTGDELMEDLPIWSVLQSTWYQSAPKQSQKLEKDCMLVWISNQNGSPELIMVKENSEVEYEKLKIPEGLDRGKPTFVWDSRKNGWWIYTCFKVNPQGLQWAISQVFAGLEDNLEIKLTSRVVLESEVNTGNVFTTMCPIQRRGRQQPCYLIVSSLAEKEAPTGKLCGVHELQSSVTPQMGKISNFRVWEDTSLSGLLHILACKQAHSIYAYVVRDSTLHYLQSFNCGFGIMNACFFAPSTENRPADTRILISGNKHLLSLKFARNNREIETKPKVFL